MEEVTIKVEKEDEDEVSTLHFFHWSLAWPKLRNLLRGHQMSSRNWY